MSADYVAAYVVDQHVVHLNSPKVRNLRLSHEPESVSLTSLYTIASTEAIEVEELFWRFFEIRISRLRATQFAELGNVVFRENSHISYGFSDSMALSDSVDARFVDT